MDEPDEEQEASEAHQQVVEQRTQQQEMKTSNTLNLSNRGLEIVPSEMWDAAESAGVGLSLSVFFGLYLSLSFSVYLFLFLSFRLCLTSYVQG